MLTESHDLRTGLTPWEDEPFPLISQPLPERPVEVAIVGGGVMGAMLAERLSAAGKSVAVVDRRAPADGLPANGRARPGERVWLASGFGGNGITFAALAAELLSAELTGASDPDRALFDPYRFQPR